MEKYGTVPFTPLYLFREISSVIVHFVTIYSEGPALVFR